MNWFIRWAITALALFIAEKIIPGIHFSSSSSWLAIIGVAAILVLVNAIIRPILQALSCALIVLTFGLFLPVINAITLALTSWIAVHWFGIGFYLESFWSALGGAILISLVMFVLSLVLRDDATLQRAQRSRSLKGSLSRWNVSNDAP